MRIASKVWNSGWGAVFLTLYSLIAVRIFDPQTYYFNVFAFLPVILVLFVADYYSFELIDFFAGGNLRRSTEQIEKLTRDDHFYEGADEQVQNRVNEFDDHAYKYTVAILSTIVIALTAPLLGYFVYGIQGLIVAILLSVISIQWLGRRSVRELNSLAEDVVEPYKAKYENQ